MAYLFDTNHASQFLRSPEAMEARLGQRPDARMSLCPPVAAELWYMVYKSGRVEKNRQDLERLLRRFEWLSFDGGVAEIFGRTKVLLKRVGKTVADVDLQIASVALAHDVTLLTDDQALSNVPGLRIENWLR